ncbi:hypothetical protein O6H91_22G009800 [Diphasiastrum complanatum]|uniref:Uncharacterized protein n=1 Tax=Diphasiastrum complanatum TaxID=34168 RepID=A0ACC2ACW5_DIPCM|nr:hypothetical protein O6H91_22G009800 [Diphasiastrum complanatum]
MNNNLLYADSQHDTSIQMALPRLQSLLHDSHGMKRSSHPWFHIASITGVSSLKCSIGINDSYLLERGLESSDGDLVKLLQVSDEGGKPATYKMNLQQPTNLNCERTL